MKDINIILEILSGKEIQNILILLLNVILGIKKGDIYNVETLNKRLGKHLLPKVAI